MMQKEQDCQLYFDFIPLVVKSWLKRKGAKLHKEDFEDVVSELYCTYRDQPRFKDYTLVEDPSMFYSMFYYRVPSALKKILSNTYEIQDHEGAEVDDDEFITHTETTLPADKRFVDIAFDVWLKKKPISDIASKYGVSESTIYRWIESIKRMIKKLMEA